MGIIKAGTVPKFLIPSRFEMILAECKLLSGNIHARSAFKMCDTISLLFYVDLPDGKT